MTPVISSSTSAASSLRIMRALLAKDWRFFRVPMLALLIASAGSYLFVVVAQWFSHSEDMQLQMLNAIEAGSGCAATLVALIASAFGGVALAEERTDRTADFIAMLPVTRMQIMLSKLLVSFFMLGGCLAIHVAIAFAFAAHNSQFHEQFVQDVAMLDGFTVGFFGVAWLLGTFLKSGPISACVAIGVTISAAMLIVNIMHGRPEHTSHDEQAAIAVVTAGIGFASLLLGTMYYLRRITP